MKWISSGLSLIFFAMTANADLPPSPRPSHPLSWMHGLPVGEQPGWSQKRWFNFEMSNGNVWNAPLIMHDRRNGKKYEFFADYEQLHTVMEFGKAFNDWFAAGLEIPFAYRSGGMMDDFIDDYHILIGNRRFNRQFYPENQNNFSVKTDDVEAISQDNPGNGLSSVKIKMKAWLWEWYGVIEGSCACGFAISSQTKIPLQKARRGGSSGEIDQSLLMHFGLPLFTESALWFTGGYTWLGDNDAMAGWPRYNYSILYEGQLELALSKNWGFTLNVRSESPFLDRSKLTYFDTATEPKIIARNRAASGWNGLVHWRGSQSIGLRYKTDGGGLIHILMSEDWGIGPNDADDDVYTNNAPDVSFTLQTQFTW